MIYLKLNLTKILTQKTKNQIEESKYLNCSVINVLNKRRVNEKKCSVYSRAAFNNIFACLCGVYLRAAFIRVITVIDLRATNKSRYLVRTGFKIVLSFPYKAFFVFSFLQISKITRPLKVQQKLKAMRMLRVLCVAEQHF